MILKNRILIVVILSFVVLSACQSAPTNLPATASPVPVETEEILKTDEPVATTAPTSTKTSPPTQESLPTAPPTADTSGEGAAIIGIQEELETTDGLVLIGTFYAPEDVEPPWPGVILLHMLWSDRSAWDEYAIELASNGFAVFTLDMRGHGETGGEVNWDLAKEDIQLIWDTLASNPNIDPGRIGIVGASIGANMALVSGADEPDTRTVVLLSPGLSYAGVETTDAMVGYGERPVFIAASQEDTYSANSSEKLYELAIGESRLDMYQDAGHGTFMLENQPELGGEIIVWMQEFLQ
jgi:dienelactone hydrolase